MELIQRNRRFLLLPIVLGSKEYVCHHDSLLPPVLLGGSIYSFLHFARVRLENWMDITKTISARNPFHTHLSGHQMQCIHQQN